MDVLEISGLTKSFRQRFPSRTVDAVKGLDLRIEAGSVVAFVGPNGAGKTTTLLAILGFLKPDEGSISVLDSPAGSLEAKRRLGFQSEIFFTYPYHTARRALSFYGRLSGLRDGGLHDAVELQLDRLGLAHAAERKVGTFSKGMTQRLGLAAALLHEPELLLLDEPTTGLDPEGRKLVADLIAGEKARGRTVFLSSHILTDVERTCDRVVMIRKGELVLSQELGAEEDDEFWEVRLSGPLDGAKAALDAAGLKPYQVHDAGASFQCSPVQKAELLGIAGAHGLDVAHVERRGETLEELYMKHVGGTSDG